MMTRHEFHRPPRSAVCCRRSMRSAVAGGVPRGMPRHFPGPSVAGSGSSTQSRPAKTCCNGGWLRCSTCWPSCRERTNADGAQLNAEAVE
eukprot:scaffold31573_cov33-Phaeocystis_antarctica.AAC.1